MQKIFILMLIFQISSCIFAQKLEQYEKWFIGWNTGLQVGPVINLSASIHVGHYVAKKISLGIGTLYNYYNDARFSNMLELHIWGAKTFARFDIIDELFIHLEYEYLTYKTDIFNPMNVLERIQCHNVLIGGGYKILFSSEQKDCTYVMLLYNINDTFKTPYSNPVFRVGFEIHF